MYAAGMVVELTLINRRGGGFMLTLSGVWFYLGIIRGYHGMRSAFLVAENLVGLLSRIQW
jgi:hypothetical protein